MNRWTYRSALAASALMLIFLVSCGGAKPSANRELPVLTEMPQVVLMNASYSFGDRQGGPSYFTIPAADTSDALSTACLQCHGPTFKDLAAKTKNYKDPWGDNVNPHVYMDINKANPHDSTTIITCTRCHAQHELPRPAGTVRKATLQYCYNCHHTEDFRSCSECHNE